jgi:hypothetical protein
MESTWRHDVKVQIICFVDAEARVRANHPCSAERVMRLPTITRPRKRKLQFSPLGTGLRDARSRFTAAAVRIDTAFVYCWVACFNEVNFGVTRSPTTFATIVAGAAKRVVETGQHLRDTTGLAYICQRGADAYEKLCPAPVVATDSILTRTINKQEGAMFILNILRARETVRRRLLFGGNSTKMTSPGRAHQYSFTPLTNAQRVNNSNHCFARNSCIASCIRVLNVTTVSPTG